MKKLLMSVVGIGLGHATRTEAVYNRIKNKAKVKILTYYDAYRYYKSVKIPCEDFGGYVYKGKEYAFDILLQTIDFFRNPTKLRSDYVRFREIADKFKPEIIFSDSEPNAFFYAYRRNLPNYILSNLITTLNNYGLIPRKLRTRDVSIQRALLNRLIKFMVKRNGKFFVPSFERNVSYTENVNYVDLIVRKKPLELASVKKIKEKIGVNKDFYFVHVGGASIERYIFPILESILSSFKDKFFIISSDYATNKVIRKDNMIIYPFIKNPLEYIKASKGVIFPAGHSGISEAIVFKKPMLVIPLRKHVEQLVNAALVEKEGFGRACFFENRVSAKTLKDSLVKFFNSIDDIKKNLANSKFKGDGASQISKLILKQ